MALDWAQMCKWEHGQVERSNMPKGQVMWNLLTANSFIFVVQIFLFQLNNFFFPAMRGCTFGLSSYGAHKLFMDDMMRRYEQYIDSCYILRI